MLSEAGISISNCNYTMRRKHLIFNELDKNYISPVTANVFLKHLCFCKENKIHSLHSGAETGGTRQQHAFNGQTQSRSRFLEPQQHQLWAIRCVSPPRTRTSICTPAMRTLRHLPKPPCFPVQGGEAPELCFLTSVVPGQATSSNRAGLSPEQGLLSRSRF